jgi:hypothetical protein
MKTLLRHSLVVWLLLPVLLSAQSLSITSSTPTDNSAGVALNTTVVIKWNLPLKIGTVSLDSIGERFMVFPEDKITIHGVSYAENQTELRFEVTHQADVDYIWSFFALQSSSGVYQNQFEIVRYTTRAAPSPLFVSGRLAMKDSTMAPDFSNAVVMLLSDLTFMDSENDDGPGDAVKSASRANPLTGEYAMLNVQPGTYYLMAMMFSIDQGRMETIGIGTYADKDGKPIQVFISMHGLSNVNLDLWPTDYGGGDPVDATQAFALLKERAAMADPLARPLFLEGRNPHMPPEGDSNEWMGVFFSESDSTVQMIVTDGSRIVGYQSMHYLDIPAEERLDVDITTIKSIPDVFVPSRNAYQMALQNGLGELLAPVMMNHDVWVEAVYNLSHFYFEHDEFVSAASNPFWTIEVYFGSETGFTEASFLIDAITGAFLGKEIKQEQWMPQALQIVGSNPPDLTSTTLLQGTIAFSFNEPIDPNSFNLNNRNRNWSVTPDTSVAISDIRYSIDGHTVYLDVTHRAETDYIWTFMSVRGINGAIPRTTQMVRYTTKAAISPLSVSGSLMWQGTDMMMLPNQVMVVAILMDSPAQLTGDIQGPIVGIQNAGTLLPDGWTYQIANVRPGTYYPGVFVLEHDLESLDMIAYGFYSGSDGQPASITITDQSRTDVHLSMRMESNEPEHHPIDLLQVYDTVKQHVAAQATGAELITAYGREEIYRPMMPTGTSFDWSFIYYESATDTVQMMMAGSDGIFMIDRFHISNIPEEERIPKELVKPLPNTFIGSGQAMMVARSNGLDELINSTPPEAWAQVRFGVSQFYFQYPDFLNSTSPPFWDVQYNAEIWDNQNNLTWQREANFLIDAVSGAFINKRVTTDLEDADAPLTIQLDQNYPNPFNPNTVIGFRVGTQDLASVQVKLSVYDILGREVAVLVDGVMPAGSHTVVFDASALPSGVYVYRLESDGKELQRKFTLIK